MGEASSAKEQGDETIVSGYTYVCPVSRRPKFPPEARSGLFCGH